MRAGRSVLHAVVVAAALGGCTPFGAEPADEAPDDTITARTPPSGARPPASGDEAPDAPGSRGDAGALACRFLVPAASPEDTCGAMAAEELRSELGTSPPDAAVRVLRRDVPVCGSIVTDGEVHEFFLPFDDGACLRVLFAGTGPVLHLTPPDGAAMSQTTGETSLALKQGGSLHLLVTGQGSYRLAVR
jgi:hypothetical protein